jgi:hypothetical protein
MAHNEFPDADTYQFKQEAHFNPLMRNNSILTPTLSPQVGAHQSTNSSTNKLSDSDTREENEAKEDETFPRKRFCQRTNEDDRKLCGGILCKSELDHASSNGEDFSVATKAASNKRQCQESISEESEEEDDMIYVPFDYQGDGRKREAKRHKSHTVVPRDEIDLDAQIRDR